MVYGSLIRVHILKHHRNKLVPKSKHCMLVGCDQSTKGNKLYEPNSQNVLISNDVIVDNSIIGLDPIVYLPILLVPIDSAHFDNDL